ncbi:hypothetical protein AVEN_44407-1 [Araneus ventricosus]|uniref:Uncharacterized protein n=1 Tax=Araneus ventricosus TaxID=182803 RepID=A0A4Y2GW61_ARAVE|nr:hypothetical protein AVEN_267016-1 [Araneus ventricosus]GBM57128.1 hypothetical protein AVEN_44407-1 [Araneus ventricosus]
MAKRENTPRRCRLCYQGGDIQQDPVLFEIVSKHMIHGPFGALNMKSPCMKDTKCTKRYPRKMIHETQTAEEGYPLYRRRKPEQGGHTTVINLRINNKYHEVEGCTLLAYFVKDVPSTHQCQVLQL